MIIHSKPRAKPHTTFISCDLNKKKPQHGTKFPTRLTVDLHFPQHHHPNQVKNANRYETQ
ncbi:hypothetical protein NC99_04940 [Sunxiuqinia dokdonensis]|uniref:Uncharacterized protein n=1 Tax=Sunxiuqinia dokdonensis TaxID=1409788 RepID=A0A0L8VDY1_9BACT|nr:hypothetical protein NC99_04940 [Sunxiuqinia dokdonensis]